MAEDNKRKEQCTIQNVMCSLTDDEKLELVKQLRKETGWSMMDCKRALSASNWEVEGAKSWLIQYRKKSGIMFD
jgi:ribosomal protein L7/L12